MSRSLSRFGLSLVVLALLAVPASADVFFVTLTNGTVIETARQPQQASWDPNMVLLLTEVGNWVGFSKDEIKNVRSEDPQQGFGIKISDKAIALGRAPNDLPGAKTKQEEAADRYLEYANRLLDIMDQERLLQGNPLLERSIRNRFPYLDPLNHVQVELLKAHRAQNADEQVLRGIQLTINGISAGLRNSG